MGSLFNSPAPPGPLPDPPNPPNLFDPRIAAMRRQRLEELKRKKGRQATILTAGLGDRTETARQPVGNSALPVLPGAPYTANTLLGAESNFGKGRARVRLPGKKHTATATSPPASTIPIDALVQLVGVGQTPTPPQPQPPASQHPETPQRPQIQETAGKIVAIEEEIERLKSEPVDLPPIPGRMPRRPFRLRKQIPDAAKDIDQARRSLNKFEKRKRIRALEQEIATFEQELENLRESEKRFEDSAKHAQQQLQECEAKNA